MLVPLVRRVSVLVVATAVSLSVGVATSPPAQAVGTPPAPEGDTLAVIGKDVLDVLANDSDPDVQLLTVSANTQPSHGTATCLGTGICTYTPTVGYLGSDSFTYTARDPDANTASATVTITVSAPPATTSPPTPVPDEMVTRAGQAVTRNVLTNDQVGSSATVTKTAGPSHGTASCTSAGSCTYTPANGFVGYDGFAYDVTDGFGTSRGTALITVVDSAAGFQQVASGRPATAPSGTTIVQGDSAAWNVGARPVPAGLPQQWAAANPPPSTTATLTGPHSFVGSTTTSASGWTSTSSSSTRGFAPGSGALLGESTTNPLPPPLPPISQGTGGDGHVPILVGSKVFAFFHHATPTSVTCIDRTTGALCPGYPRQLTVSSSDVIGPAAIVGSKLYVNAQTAPSYAQSAPIALYCWDTATDSTCGMIVLTRLLGQQANAGASAPRLISNRMYLAADGGVVHCADPATGAVCGGSFPFSNGLDPALGQGFTYDAVTHGTRLFVSRGQGSGGGPVDVTCIDVAAPARCSGWTPVKVLHSPDLVNHRSTSGTPDGVCSVDSSSGECILDSTPTTISTTGGWPVNELYYSISEEAEAGTRTLFATGLGSSGMGCWNWVTNALCTGGRWVDGVITTDAGGASLPDAYGAAFDGTCAVGVGDPGQVFTVDPAGFSPCTSLSAGSVRRVVDLREQRCDGTVGAATWTDLRVLESNLTAGQDFNSLTVTVSDASTDEVLLSQEVVGTSGVLSLSGVDATLHPSLAIDATADSPAGNAAWADGNPPRLVLRWHSDPAQGCFQTTTAVDCSVTSPQSVGILSTPTTGTAATASLTLDPRTDCKTLTVARGGTGTGTVTSTPAGISCGATCAFAWVSGTTVTLTATPTAGHVFTGWSGGGCSGVSTCVVTLTANTPVTATFTADRTLTVTKSGAGTGSVTSNPAGISCGATCSASFANGSTVVLTATPTAGSLFAGWSGGGCSGTGTCTVALASDTTVNAVFAVARTLTVNKAGAGSGTVSSSPAGISCGATCAASFADGTSVTLTATPAAGSVLTGWSGGGCGGTGTCVLTLTGNTTVTATFAVVQRTLTVAKSGTGSGTVTSSPAGISCGATCSASYADGTSVTLTATPAGGSSFAGWSGGGCSGTGTCTTVLTGDTTVTATFTTSAQPSLGVTKTGTGSGVVTSNPAGISCGATCTATFPSGTSVTLTAVPEAGSAFAGWSGAGCSGTGTCVLSLASNTTVTATFIARRTLTVTKSGSGTGTVTSSPAGISCGATCAAPYDDGTTVTLTPAPAPGSAFTGWSGGGCSSSSSICTVTLTANTTVTATFKLLREVAVSKAGTGTGTVTSSPPGLHCGTTCVVYVEDGITVTLTAAPSAGSTFTGWSGSGCSGTATCVLTMSADRAVTATFTADPQGISLTVVKAGGGTGTVTSDPAGISCGATCVAGYGSGSTVTLSAVWDADTVFAGWSGGGCGRASLCTVTLLSPTTVTATFRPFTPRLSLVRAGTGSGTVTSSPAGIDCGTVCANTYAYGTPVTLTATPVPGAAFSGWTGGGCSGTGTCTIGLVDDRTVTAGFDDVTAPTVRMTQPTAYFSSTRSLVATWIAKDTGGSGVGRVEAAWQRRSVGGSAFSAWRSEPGWTSLTGSSVSLGGVASAYQYCFRARAVDVAGRTGAWSAPRCTRVPVDDRSLAATSGWTLRTGQAGYFDGSHRSASTLGASLRTMASVTSTRVGVLATTCSACGAVDVYVGTSRVGRLSLVSSSTVLHRWLVLPAFSTARSGVITLRVASSGKLVRVDALGYTRV